MKSKRIRAWTREEILALGGLTDLETAGQILNRGRTKAYLQAKQKRFPVEVLDEDGSYKVRVYDLLRYLRMCPCGCTCAYTTDNPVSDPSTHAGWPGENAGGPHLELPAGGDAGSARASR
jgi:hypothetical protein